MSISRGSKGFVGLAAGFFSADFKGATIEDVDAAALVCVLTPGFVPGNGCGAASLVSILDTFVWLADFWCVGRVGFDAAGPCLEDTSSEESWRVTAPTEVIVIDGV
jgi:hypothetical protein